MKQRIADFIDVIFGLRKFLAWVALFIVAIVFRLSNHVDGAQFVDLVKGTFLAFAAANGVEHLVSVAKQYVDVKTNQTVTPSPTAGDDLVTPDQIDPSKVGK